MFHRAVEHPMFQRLYRRLFYGWEGVLRADLGESVQISIRGRSREALRSSLVELERVLENLEQIKTEALSEAHGSYEAMRDAVEAGDFDVEIDSFDFPVLDQPMDVWNLMRLEFIEIDLGGELQIRLGFDCVWDVEHGFGIYLTDGRYQYAGVSV